MKRDTHEKICNRIKTQFDLIKIDWKKEKNCVYVAAHRGFGVTNPERGLQFIKNETMRTRILVVSVFEREKK